MAAWSTADILPSVHILTGSVSSRGKCQQKCSTKSQSVSVCVCSARPASASTAARTGTAAAAAARPDARTRQVRPTDRVLPWHHVLLPAAIPASVCPVGVLPDPRRDVLRGPHPLLPKAAARVRCGRGPLPAAEQRQRPRRSLVCRRAGRAHGGEGPGNAPRGVGHSRGLKRAAAAACRALSSVDWNRAVDVLWSSNSGCARVAWALAKCEAE